MPGKDNEEKKDDTEKKDEEEQTKVLESLDDVHEQAIAELENESQEDDEDDDSTEDDKDAEEKDTESDNDDGDDDNDADDKEEDIEDGDTRDDAEGDVDDDDQSDSASRAETDTDAEDDKSAAELDTDVTKPGKGKVSVKAYDGTTYHFNNWDEVPDDFEPASYKEMGRFTHSMNEKLRSDQQAEAEAQERAARREREARIAKVKESWEKDIKHLTDDKVLPTDKKERKQVIDGVYKLMEDELQKGRALDFAPAYEIYAYRNQLDGKKERVKKEQSDKKKRAGKVMGAGSGAGGAGRNKQSGGGKVYDAPPSGVSLDDVHSSVLGSL